MKDNISAFWLTPKYRDSRISRWNAIDKPELRIGLNATRAELYSQYKRADKKQVKK